MTPGRLLREARRRHGVTQEQLAARAGTSQAAISRIERDVVSPSVGTLASLLDLLGEELELSATQIDYGHDRTLDRGETSDSAPRIASVAGGVDFANFVASQSRRWRTLRNRSIRSRSSKRSSRRTSTSFVIGGVGGMARTDPPIRAFDVDIAFAEIATISTGLPRRSSSLGQPSVELPRAFPILDADTIERGAHFTFDTPAAPWTCYTDPTAARVRKLVAAAGDPARCEAQCPRRLPRPPHRDG